MLVLCGVGFVFMVIGGMNPYFSFRDYLDSMVQGIIVFAIWMIYFTKAVRGRTYLGGDDYLKHSTILYIFKKA